MDENEMSDLLANLQDIRDDIYILGNTKSALSLLESIIKTIDIKLSSIKANR